MHDVILVNRDFLAAGLLATLQISAISIVCGTLIGAVVALLRYLRVPFAARFCALYVGLIQGAPLLVVLLFCYFALPALFGYKTTAYWATVLSFSVFIGAYLAEDIRAGLQSVSPKLIQAALASGLTMAQVLRLVVLPIGVRSVIPPIISQYVRLIKFTSVASIISVQELTGNALLVNARVFEPATILSFVAIVYLIVCQAVSLFGRWLNARFAVRT
jgi:His/Glu/Gln/Arg/opine family amino acid ABC transporter permease subunit